jgi:hypothetical protein
MSASPLRIISVFLALAGVWSSRATAQEEAWTLFPGTHVFPRLLADGTAPGISLNKDLRTRTWIGGIGGLAEVLQYSSGDWTFQAGLGANVYASLNRKPKILEVVTADFYVYIPLDIGFGDRFSFRTGYGHYSAHLADDGIEILQLHSINYAKDYVPFLCSYRLPEVGGLVYGGMRFDYYSIPETSSHWVAQAGLEAGNLSLTSWLRAYAAVDLRFKSEVAWASTQSYQIGLKIGTGPWQAVRLAFTIRTGIDDRGQFYRDRVTWNLLGAYLDV